MSLNKIRRVQGTKTKAEFFSINGPHFTSKYNFLPPAQVKGKLEEAWKKMNIKQERDHHVQSRGKTKPSAKIVGIMGPRRPLGEKNPATQNGVNNEKTAIKLEPKYGDAKKTKAQTTTIEVIDEKDESIGFIELDDGDAYLKKHSGEKIPWRQSTPIRFTRNSHLKAVPRLPFSPIEL